MMQNSSRKITILWDYGIGFTMVEYSARAWSSTREVFWKKSFQTSTGYFLWLPREQFISGTKLLAVRWVALKKEKKERNGYGEIASFS